jgi:hypothetical protein
MKNKLKITIFMLINLGLFFSLFSWAGGEDWRSPRAKSKTRPRVTTPMISQALYGQEALPPKKPLKRG